MVKKTGYIEVSNKYALTADPHSWTVCHKTNSGWTPYHWFVEFKHALLDIIDLQLKDDVTTGSITNLHSLVEREKQLIAELTTIMYNNESKVIECSKKLGQGLAD